VSKTAKTINTVHNNTAFTPAVLATLPVIGTAVNKWRGRNITLYGHPSDASRLVSVGVTFDGTMTVIADESRDEWATALDYASRGKVYVSE
jgi:hypothetical protein